MKRNFLLSLCTILLLSIVLQSCKAGKGCGCGNNLNYYNPKKGR